MDYLPVHGNAAAGKNPSRGFLCACQTFRAEMHWYGRRCLSSAITCTAQCVVCRYSAFISKQVINRNDALVLASAELVMQGDV